MDTTAEYTERTERTREQVEQELRALLVERFSVPAKDITPDAHFFDTLGLDSVDLLSVIAILEERYGLTISDEELQQMLVVDEAVDHLLVRLRAS